MKITKPPTEVYRTFTTRIYTYIVTYKKIVVKPLYFSAFCETVGNTSFLKSYNFVTILLQPLHPSPSYLFSDLGEVFFCPGGTVGGTPGEKLSSLIDTTSPPKKTY